MLQLEVEASQKLEVTRHVELSLPAKKLWRRVPLLWTSN